MPDMLSLIFSILLYSCFVLRMKSWSRIFKDVPDFLASILCVFVLGSFLKLCLGFDIVPGVLGNIINAIGLESLNKVRNLLVTAVIFSWVGMKFVSVLIWALLLILLMAHMDKIDSIMPRVSSVIFLLSSFSGFVFYFGFRLLFKI